MVDGNIKVGLIIDENADDAQADAIGQIASGSAGGPMAALAPLVGEMAGIEKRAITIEGEGLTFSLKAGELVNLSVEGLPEQMKMVSLFTLSTYLIQPIPDLL